VDRQDASADSLLQFTRGCLRLRRAHPALHHGSIKVTRADEQLLVFERAADGERMRCTFNLSNRPAKFDPSGTKVSATGDLDGDMLGAYSAVIEEIA
jgi:alpha-glucosidase